MRPKSNGVLGKQGLVYCCCTESDGGADDVLDLGISVYRQGHKEWTKYDYRVSAQMYRSLIGRIKWYAANFTDDLVGNWCFRSDRLAGDQRVWVEMHAEGEGLKEKLELHLPEHEVYS
jgi:hypothetical protein